MSNVPYNIPPGSKITGMGFEADRANLEAGQRDTAKIKKQLDAITTQLAALSASNTLPAFSLDIACDGVWLNGNYNFQNWNDPFPNEVKPAQIIPSSNGQIIPCEFHRPTAGTYRLCLDLPVNYNLSDVQVCNDTGSVTYGNVVSGISGTAPGVNIKADTGANLVLAEGWNKIYFKVIVSRGYVILKRLRFVKL